jgi:hypothetical protein
LFTIAGRDVADRWYNERENYDFESHSGEQTGMGAIFIRILFVFFLISFLPPTCSGNFFLESRL